MRSWLSILVVASAIYLSSAGIASAQCAREGQELCQNGQVARCERTGSELTPILQPRLCVVDARSINGTWRGVGTQSPAGPSGSWSIVMTIGDSGGSIDYPSLGCGGVLTPLSRTATSAVFRERLTYGQDICLDDEMIAVNLVDGNLVWRAEGDLGGQHFVATSTLSR